MIDNMDENIDYNDLEDQIKIIDSGRFPNSLTRNWTTVESALQLLHTLKKSIEELNPMQFFLIISNVYLYKSEDNRLWIVYSNGMNGWIVSNENISKYL